MIDSCIIKCAIAAISLFINFFLLIFCYIWDDRDQIWHALLWCVGDSLEITFRILSFFAR